MNNKNTLIHDSNLLDIYENGKLTSYEDYGKDAPATYAVDSLGSHEISGIPMIIRRHEDDKKLYATFTENTHALIIGATRSGKTTGYIIPTIFTLSAKKNKDSMLISDPKGELYMRTAETLRKRGYKVILLNFRDYLHSECWNMLTPIFRKYQAAISLENSIEAVEENGKFYQFFEGKKYKSQRTLNRDLEFRKRIMLDEVAKDIDELGALFVTVEKKSDPYWEESARDLLKGFLHAMLEDSQPSAENTNPITEETFSFDTILNILANFQDTSGTHYNDSGYFSSRKSDSVALRLVKNCLLENAPVTRKCVMSSFNAKMSVFREVAVRMITSRNTFELEELANNTKPVAVFVSYRDEMRISYKLVQIFISNAYMKLIEIANRNKSLTLERPFYFILDEFGNLPAIGDFETTISACGGRNIWLILVLQSYAQLYRVYDRDVGEIIKDNLNMHVFLGTNNPDTKKAFSEECGLKTVISPMSALNGQGETIDRYDRDTVPLVPISRLNHFETGECVVTRTNSESVLWSKLERSYLTPELNGPLADSDNYDSGTDFFSKKFTYNYVPRRKKGSFDDD